MARLRRIVVSLLLCAVPALAGITYTSSTRIESGDGKLPGMSQQVRMQAWVSGGNAKLEVFESGVSILSAGSYMLKRSDNAAMLLVNPSKKTYSTVDPNALLSDLNKSVKSLFRIEDAKWEKVADPEEGPEISGYPTKHYRYRFTYRMVVKVDGEEVSAPSTVEQEFWVTDKLSDPALAAVQDYQFTQNLAGLNSDIEQMIRAEVGEMKGFVLKQHWSVTTKADKETIVQNITTSISDIQNTDIPNDVFAIPPSFTETPAPKFEMPSDEKSSEVPNLR